MQKYQNGLAPIIIIGLVILSLAIAGGGAAGYYLLNKNKVFVPAIVNNQAPQQKACTMEAKICPDGSAVGRTGPNCEFAACP